MIEWKRPALRSAPTVVTIRQLSLRLLRCGDAEGGRGGFYGVGFVEMGRPPGPPKLMVDGGGARRGGVDDG